MLEVFLCTFLSCWGSIDDHELTRIHPALTPLQLSQAGLAPEGAHAL